MKTSRYFISMLSLSTGLAFAVPSLADEGYKTPDDYMAEIQNEYKQKAEMEKQKAEMEKQKAELESQKKAEAAEAQELQQKAFRTSN